MLSRLDVLIDRGCRPKTSVQGVQESGLDRLFNGQIGETRLYFGRDGDGASNDALGWQASPGTE